jgi:hypothetical protein
MVFDFKALSVKGDLESNHRSIVWSMAYVYIVR